MGSLMDELSFVQAFKRLTPTVDRTKEPRIITTERLCICVLGTSSRHLDLLLEGGDICPGDVMIALSPDYLQRDATGIMKETPSQVLLVKKALTFERGGNSYLDVFEPPRRVTYFINELPESFDSSGLDCAMNGSNTTMSLLKDRLLWRAEICQKLSPPPCIVLHRGLSPEFKHTLNKMTDLKMVEGPPNRDKSLSLKDDISEMLSMARTAERKVIIGKRISGGFQKELFLIDDASFIDSLSEVWQSLCEDEYITIETNRLLPKSKTGLGVTGPSKETVFSVSAHLTIGFGLDNRLIFSKVTASATLASRSDRSASVYKDLKTCLIDLGYTDPVCLQQVEESMKTQAKAVTSLVEDAEKSATGSYLGSRTDYLQLIFHLTILNGVVTPILCDVSTQHTFLGTWGDNANGLLSPSRVMLHVMAIRSHSGLLSGKKMLFLLHQRFVDTRMRQFEDIRKYGNKVIAVAPKSSPDARKYVDELIEYDLLDGTDYIQHAEYILEQLRLRDVHISGCIAFGDNYGLVASKLRQLLHLPGASVEAVKAANQKYLTYSKLWATPSAIYSSKAVKVNSWKEMEMSSSKIDYPAFAKMEAGKGAIGARIVNDADDCKHYLTDMCEKISTNEKDFELINGNKSFVVTELLEGDEYIVDVVMSQSQFIAGFIRRTVQGKPPYFTCRAQAFPAPLAGDKEKTLFKASHQICYDLGLHDGVFNVELMDTEEGPKLIEVNARHGSHGIAFLTKHCLDEDIFMLNNLVNAGIRPTVVSLPAQRLSCSFLLSLRHHCHLVGDETFQAMVETMHNRKIIFYEPIRDSNFSIVDKVIAFLGAVDEDMEKSKIILLSVAKALGLDSADFPCADLLDSLSMRTKLI